MDHTQRELWLERLCVSGKLDRSEVGDSESSFLQAITEWGIEYSLSDRQIVLDPSIQLINLGQIRSELTSLPGAQMECRYRLVTPSTNTDALAYFDQYHQPCVALAEMQTAGKGRRGNQWVSPFARNIYCSIGISKSIRASTLGLLSIVTGIALCRALEACGVSGVQLKWPNDLYFQDKKLGGILIESKPLSVDDYFVAIGFGINVMMSDDDLAGIPQPATSIDRINKAVTSRDTILCEAIRQVIEMIDGFEESGIPGIIDEFNDYDALHGKRIWATTAEESIDGMNAGINSIGQIQLDSEQGRLMFSAAEISLRGMD